MGYRILCSLALLMALMSVDGIGVTGAIAQEGQNPTLLTSDSLADPTLFLFAGASGFLPFKESYRINYSTRFAGLPFDVQAGLSFPVSRDVQVPFSVHFLRREARFVEDFTLSTLQIEPGIFAYLEPQRSQDLRLFGHAGLILQRTDVEGYIEASEDGINLRREKAVKNYYDLGLGVGLGLAYPVTTHSTLDLDVRLAFLFANPVERGGLGNTGGLLVGLIYRYGL